MLDPNEFIITRKRKKYKFAIFANSPLCFEVEDWQHSKSPTMLEVGAGTGLFSVSMARADPDVSVLAVDVKADRLQTGARLAESEKMHNIYFLRSRVDQLSDLLAPHSLDTVWITFPDPFPKDRASKHRLTHPHYLAIYKQLLRSSGSLYFKTDAKDLFDWSLEQLVASGWGIRQLSFDLHESDLPDPYKVMTTYEKRFVSEGIKINFVKATPPR